VIIPIIAGRGAEAMRAGLGAILAALTLTAAPAAGAAEIPDPGAPEAAEPTAELDRAYDRYTLPVGAFGPEGGETRALAGRVIRRAFRLADTERSTEAVMAGYRRRLEAMGFTVLLDCAAAACGGLDFRFGVELLPPPDMLIDSTDFAQLSAHRPAADGTAQHPGEAYVSVLVSRVLGSIYVQTVTVLPRAGPEEARIGPAPLLPEPEAGAGAEPEAGAAAGSVVLPRDTRALRRRLIAEGHVPVAGLAFETGGAALSPGSARALDALAEMLSADPELAVVIVGHSDNEGGLEINLDLSERRARAVMEALIARGVPAAQLDARGVGFLAPITSNATEKGRARNRRVELVLR